MPRPTEWTSGQAKPIKANSRLRSRHVEEMLPRCSIYVSLRSMGKAGPRDALSDMICFIDAAAVVLLKHALRFACCIRKSLVIARKHWRMTSFTHSASLTPALIHIITVGQETDQIHIVELLAFIPTPSSMLTSPGHLENSRP